MTEYGRRQQGGQSIILVAVALVALVLFAAIAVDISNGYAHRRTAQNAADGAALAGARQLAHQINRDSFNDSLIKAEMNDFAERNGIKDTDGVPGNAVNEHVVGYYLNDKEKRVSNVPVGSASVPKDAWGIEALTYITAPTYFGGIFGLDGLPLNATAAVVLEKACGADCVVPIATHMRPFTAVVTATACFNIWNGLGPGNFGWLNWSRQETGCIGERCPIPCDQDECSSPCLEQNLDPDQCSSGFIQVGDWVAGKVGVVTGGNIRKQLKYYIDTPQEFTVIVWDKTNEQQGCGPEPNGLEYHVAGFARMQLLGYQLSEGVGQGTKYGHDGTGCTNLGEPVGVPPNEGNRLTARFIQWVGGEGGRCKAVGSLRAPRLKW